MISTETLSTFRRIMFAITGLTCLACAGLALVQMRPDPFPFWIPGILGLISAALIFALAAAAGRIDIVPHLRIIHGHGRGRPAHGICGDGHSDGGGIPVVVYV